MEYIFHNMEFIGTFHYNYYNYSYYESLCFQKLRTSPLYLHREKVHLDRASTVAPNGQTSRKHVSERMCLKGSSGKTTKKTQRR